MSKANPRARRDFLKLAAGATGSAAALALIPALVRAQEAPAAAPAGAELPHLADTDPTAQALGYKEDTTEVDTAKFPNHKPEQLCKNCNFFTAGSGEYGPCQLFPGKAVHANGWCAGYVVKA